MKRLFLVLLSFWLLTFAGCSCRHTWMDANCRDAKTCAKCADTKGAPLGHSWLVATCTTPKTCERCDLVEGEALGHSWKEANCVTGKTCETCGKTEGAPLGHNWMAATTDSAQVCSLCGLTEGSPIVTDPRFTTASASPFLGIWQAELVLTGEDLALPALEETLIYAVTLTFGSAGDLKMEIAPKNLDSFSALLADSTAESMYQEFAGKGMSREAADDAIKSQYGMGVADYCTAVVALMDLENLFSHMNRTEVYYVADGVLYRGLSWNGEMTPADYTTENGQLVIEEIRVLGDEPLVFTKTEE